MAAARALASLARRVCDRAFEYSGARLVALARRTAGAADAFLRW